MSDDGGGAKPPFIVLEGLDGVGTTTQCERLVDRLREDGHSVTSTREPSDGPIGALIRQILSGRVVVPEGDETSRAVDGDALALLFAADRIDHVDAEVEPALGDGRIVVSDRYYHSSFAYQGDAASEGFEFDWVRTLNERARRPDLTIFLEAPAEVCLRRLEVRGRRDRYESAESLERLENHYAEVVRTLRTSGEPIEMVDATRSVDEIHDDVYASVRPLLGS